MPYEQTKTSDENLKKVLRELRGYRTSKRALPRELATTLNELAKSIGEDKPLSSRNLEGVEDPLLPPVTINLRKNGFERDAGSESADISIELAAEYQVVRVLVESNSAAVILARERPYVREKYGEDDQRPRYIALVQIESVDTKPSYIMYDLYDGELLSYIHGETHDMNNLRCSAFQAA